MAFCLEPAPLPDAHTITQVALTCHLSSQNNSQKIFFIHASIPHQEEKNSMDRSQEIVNRLRELEASSPDIEASSVVSIDGLTIASALPQGIEEDRVSAMSAAMLSLGERISTELGRGNLEQVFVKGENGYVVLMEIGEEAVLTALARQQAKLGLIFLDMKRTVADLAKMV